MRASEPSEAWAGDDATKQLQQPLLDTEDSTNLALTTVSHPFLTWAEYMVTLTVCVVLLVLDTVLCSVLLWTFNKDSNGTFSQYINQSTGTVYGVVSIPVVLLRMRMRRRAMRRGDQVTMRGGGSPDKPPPPRMYLIAIGVLNGSGNFFVSIGAVHTRGETQSLLFLLGIPIVLVLSWVFLRLRPSRMASLSAVVIVGGAFVSSFDSIFHPSDDGIKELWYSALLFALAQVFLAGEKVVEEHMFKHYDMDVFVMFLWTLWTQVALGFAYYPLQTISAFGGLELTDLPSVLWDGCKCTVGVSSPGRPACDWRNPFFFWVYCCVDYLAYSSGLYIIQLGGASLMVLSTAIALPIAQMCYALPFMGSNQSGITYADAIALVLVLVGFSVFQLLSSEGRRPLELGRIDWTRVGDTLFQKATPNDSLSCD